MPSYEQTPGALNLSFNRGNDFSALIDFSIAMSGYTVSAAMHSVVSGDEIQQFNVDFVSATAGRVNLSLTDSQTLALARGTYGWSMRWTEGQATRTALTGFVEVN